MRSAVELRDIFREWREDGSMRGLTLTPIDG
jgi:hypothetical protein